MASVASGQRGDVDRPARQADLEEADGRHLAAARAREVRRDLRAVAVRARRADAGRDVDGVAVAGSASREQAPHLGGLPGELLVVGHVLELAAAARPEEGAARLDGRARLGQRRGGFGHRPRVCPNARAAVEAAVGARADSRARPACATIAPRWKRRSRPFAST